MNKHYKALELDKILVRLADCCISSGAKRKALETEPVKTLSEAADLMTKTDDAYRLISGYSTPAFSGAKDVTESLTRAKAGGMLNPGELLQIGRLLKNVHDIKRWRSNSEGIETSLDYLFKSLTENRHLCDRIFVCIKSEEEISDNASPELFNIRRKLSSAANSIRERLDKVVRSATYQKFLQDAIITQRNGRYVVPVKAEYKGEIPGLVHDTSSTGSTVFIEPMAVVEANNEIKILRSKEAEEIEKILYELTAQVSENEQSIISSLEIITELDYIFAKAKLAFKMKASKPILNDKCYINLKKVRHPLLNPDTVVPVNVSIGDGYRLLVITGPNTGGKTVTIKAVGLISVMAACGLMIPCADGSEVAVFNNVFADIGDEQSIEQSLSTFSSHIKNIVSIIDTVDNNTLILLDELCSGTDPVEGAALATAILETFKKFGATVAATTHYAELKAYALDTEGVENACCEFDVATLAPTYRLLIGVPGRSNAFSISSALGMDDGIIRYAKELVTAENSRFERVIEGLEVRRKELDVKREEMEKQLAAAKQSIADAKAQAEKIKKEYNGEIENAKAQARIIADNARIEANRLIDELEKLKKSKKADTSSAEALARKAFKKMDDISSTGEKYKENYSLPRPLKVGDTVLMTDTDQKATVLALADSKNRVQVQAGIMKIKISLDSLRLVEEKSVNIPKSVYRTRRRGLDSKSTKTASLEIDVRGKTVDEASLELDRFIDEAQLNSIQQFTVIHGKGTGALRKGLQTFLRSHPSVRTFRVGLYGEGEEGVTIVELK